MQFQTVPMGNSVDRPAFQMCCWRILNSLLGWVQMHVQSTECEVLAIILQFCMDFTENAIRQCHKLLKCAV